MDWLKEKSLVYIKIFNNVELNLNQFPSVDLMLTLVNSCTEPEEMLFAVGRIIC